jgi:hypothetical protein
MKKNKDPKIIDITPFIKKRKKEKLNSKNTEEDYPDLSYVAEILVNVSLILDEIGYHNYADKVSDVLADMFEDDDLKNDPKN